MAERQLPRARTSLLIDRACRRRRKRREHVQDRYVSCHPEWRYVQQSTHHRHNELGTGGSRYVEGATGTLRTSSWIGDRIVGSTDTHSRAFSNSRGAEQPPKSGPPPGRNQAESTSPQAPAARPPTPYPNPAVV